MLLFEYDAKELLAVQGIPVPGGIRLNHAPRPQDLPSDDPSGPWIVKPQILGGAPGLARHIVTVKTNEEICAAATSLLATTIDGRPVHAVLIERQFTPVGNAYLRFECDPPSAGVRIVAAADATDAGTRDTACPNTVVAPDPNAVIKGVEDLAAAMPHSVRTCVNEAGRMLAPLFFGYEATLLEIAPLMLLSDGGWAVGDVRLAIDEKALFRHPELLSLIERREVAYGDVRLRRRYGVDYRVIDPDGAVATLTAGNGNGYGAFLVDEMKAAGLSPYNVMEAGLTALSGSEETLEYLIDAFSAAAALRCLVVTVVGDIVELPAFAHRFAAALAGRPDFKLPIVARFIGAGAGAAGAILEQAAPATEVEPDLEAAIGRAAGYAAGRAA
jgi:succinyl-CoA synthetase beta subunit